jgi:hypothetical protein
VARRSSSRSGAPTIAVEGAKELARDFRAAGIAAKELSGAYRAIARELVPPAQRNAPKRTGRLAASTRGAGTKTSAILRAGSARVRYSGVIHFGNPTPKTYPARSGASRSTGTLGVIAPQPWLYTTLDERRDEVLSSFEEHVGAALRRNGLA